LVRAASGEHQPIQMVDGLIGTIGALASIAGIVVALLAIQPWLVPLLFLAGLPLLLGVMKAGQAVFGLPVPTLPAGVEPDQPPDRLPSARFTYGL
jgi:hypothetical protein